MKINQRRLVLICFCRTSSLAFFLSLNFVLTRGLYSLIFYFSLGWNIFNPGWNFSYNCNFSNRYTELKCQSWDENLHIISTLDIKQYCHNVTLVYEFLSKCVHNYRNNEQFHYHLFCRCIVIFGWHTSTYDSYTGDNQTNTSDIRMGYEYLRLIHRWHTSAYKWYTDGWQKYIRVTYRWHTCSYNRHRDARRET